MSLLLRVNLVLMVVFAAGATLAGLACRTLLQQFINAARQSLRAR